MRVLKRWSTAPPFAYNKATQLEIGIWIVDIIVIIGSTDRSKNDIVTREINDV